EDRIEPAEGVVPVRRNGDARLQEVVGAPRKMLELERASGFPAHRLDNSDGFGGDFASNAVTWNDSNFDRLGLHFSLARGVPPPLALALARRLRASLGPQALWLFSLRVGPHPHALSLGGSAPRSGRRRFPLFLVPCPLSLVPFPPQLQS